MKLRTVLLLSLWSALLSACSAEPNVEPIEVQPFLPSGVVIRDEWVSKFSADDNWRAYLVVEDESGRSPSGLNEAWLSHLDALDASIELIHLEEPASFSFRADDLIVQVHTRDSWCEAGPSKQCSRIRQEPAAHVYGVSFVRSGR